MQKWGLPGPDCQARGRLGRMRQPHRCRRVGAVHRSQSRSANLADAPLSRPAAGRTKLPVMLMIMVLVVTASFFAYAYPLDVAWFFALRFGLGFAEGALTVLAAAAVLPPAPPSRRGVAGGLIFMTVGAALRLAFLMRAGAVLIPALYLGRFSAGRVEPCGLRVRDRNHSAGARRHPSAAATPSSATESCLERP